MSLMQATIEQRRGNIEPIRVGELESWLGLHRSPSCLEKDDDVENMIEIECMIDY